MTYLFVGAHLEHLASGRPLLFGDTVDISELTPEDAQLADQLAEQPAAPAVPEAPAPEPTTSEA
jgi:hypothetical protein